MRTLQDLYYNKYYFSSTLKRKIKSALIGVACLLFVYNPVFSNPEKISNTIVCPTVSAIYMADAGMCGAEIMIAAPVSTDPACPIFTLINDYNSTNDASDFYQIGVTTVTFNVAFIGGGFATCSIDINVVEVESPEIVCPTHAPATCDITRDVPVYADLDEFLEAGGTVADNCGIDSSSFVFVSETAILGSCPYTINRTYAITDVFGNINGCEEVFTISDTTPPTISCPPDQEINVVSCETMVTVPLAIAADDCSTVTIVNDFNNTADASGIYPNGVTVVTFTATDLCGNTATCSTTITLINDMNLEFVLDTPMALPDLSCSDILPVQETLGFVNTCCTGTVVTNTIITDPPVPDVCVGYTVYHTWLATDDCNNERTDTISFEVGGSVPTIFAPADTLYNSGDSRLCVYTVRLETAAVGMGLCSPITGIQTVVGADTINNNGGDITLPIGANTVYYIATDACGNTSIDSSMVDIAKPCELSCKSNVNISLGGNCESEIVASMLGVDIPFECDEYYEVIVEDQHGNVIPGSIVTGDHVGWSFKVSLKDPYCGITCWGYIHLEDKFPPVIACDTVVVASCHDYSTAGYPSVADNCDNFFLEMVDELIIDLQCDPLYAKKVLRTFTVYDPISGLEGLPCQQEIYLERVTLDSIEFPADFTIACNDDYLTDDNGYPDPSVVGVPTMNGVPIYPSLPQHICSAYISYSDHELSNQDCHRKIVRTWEISEWHCGFDQVTTGIQLIKIEDFISPYFECPDTILMSTIHGCTGAGILPAITAYDDCNAEFNYAIQTPEGGLSSNGGYAELPVGVHAITYTVSDACGNATSCEVIVKVDDHTAPQVICEEFKVVSLNNDGLTEVKASVFDRASKDDCGIYEMHVRRMDDTCNPADTIFGSHIAFCCEDVGQVVQVAFRVTDYNNNSSICMVNVEVQDKLPAPLICPDDVTIYCGDGYDINSLEDFFDTASSSGNCTDSDIDEVVTSEIDDCGQGLIKREWEITRNGVTQSCYQHIHIFKQESFDYDSIVWPESFVADEVCDISGLDPEDLEAPYSTPQYEFGFCDLVAWHYEDDVFEAVPDNNACAKIIRHWTVINWCDRLPDGTFKQVHYDQEILTSNSASPEIVGSCERVYVCNDSPICQPDSLELSNIAIDDCTDPEDMRWIYDIDLFSDGVFDYTGFEYNVKDLFPYGVHTIKWTVFDNCGNKDVCQYEFELRSCKAPSPVCVHGLSVNLTAMDLVDANGNPGSDGELDAEMAELWASEFDASSFHACGNGFVFSFSQDTTDTSVTFDCDDIGIQEIELWVTDIYSGAQDFCSTFVDVQDNNEHDVCPEIGSLMRQITGSVMTEGLQSIDQVSMQLSGLNNLSTSSDLDGNYAFPFMPQGGTYWVEPNLDIEPLNGVSTLDLVLIQKHILGLQALPSPYKLLAADINRDGMVSTIDLIELRKLILGVYSTFPSNDSWRFIDSDYSFIDPTNPWGESFTDDYFIDLLISDMVINFTGIKTGDVNESVMLNLKGDHDVDSRSDAAMQLYYPVFSMDAAEHTIPVFSADAHEIQGLQFTMNIDPRKLEILEIRSACLDLTEAHVSYHLEEDGIVTVSWNNSDTKAVSIAEDQLLFEVVVKAMNATLTQDALQINSNVTVAEAYNIAGDAMVVELSSSIMEDYFAGANEAALYQNIPNPWSSLTTIQFYLPAAGQVELKLYDNSGRVLYTHDAELDAGIQEVEIQRSDIPISGVIIYELIYDQQLLSKRMMVLD